MRVLATLALLTGLATTQAVFAQTKITTVEGITEYHLNNGLVVLLFPDSSKPTVTVNVTYMVGSRHEGSGETGMAHLLEHMLFKGTATRGDIKTELKKYGADYQRLHLLGPHQLLRDPGRHRREPPLRASDGSRPHGEFQSLPPGSG